MPGLRLGLFFAAINPLAAFAGNPAPLSGPGVERWLVLGTRMQENLYLVLFGLMLLFAAFAFAYHRSIQLSRMRKALLRGKDQELEFQKLALDEHSIVSITSPRGDIIYVNQKFVDISGYSADEMIGQSHHMMKSGEHSDAFYRDMWRTIAKGNIWTGEIKNRKKDGGFYWVKATIVPFMNARGKPEKYIAIRTDITEDKAAEAQIRQFKSTLDLTSDAVYMFWPDDLRFFYLNRKAMNLTGWPEDAYGSYTPTDMVPGFDAVRFRKMVAPLITGAQKSVSFEITGFDHNPTEITIELIQPEGEKARFVAVTQDISKRKAAARDIRQFKSTLDLTDDKIYMAWPDSLKYLYLNKAAKKATGWNDGNLRNKTPQDDNPNFDFEAFRKRVKPLMSGRRRSITYETVGRMSEPIEVKVQLITPEGEPPRFVVIVRDITERKASENQIRQFKTTLDNIKDAVYMFWPGSLEFFYVNQAAQTLDGRDADELIGKTPAIVNPEFTEETFRKRQDALITGDAKFVVYESYHVKKSGETVPIEVRLQYMQPDGAAPRFVAFTRDISNRKAAENQILRFKTTLDHIEDPVYMFCPDSLKFSYVNKAAVDLSGLGEDGLLGKTPAILNPDFDLAEFRVRCKPLIFGVKNAIKYETCHLNANGDLVPFEFLLQLIEPDDEEPRFVAIGRDITERLEVDRAKAEFVSTVSHELRTPLTSIKGALGLLRSKAVGKMPEQADQLLKIAADNSDRLVRLINDILDVEKGEAGMIDLHLERLDLTLLAKQAIEANQGYAEQYDVHFKLVGTPPAIMVQGDEGRLMQVMANLMSNAAKFSKRGGDIEISLEPMTDMVRLAVRDFGTGIPKEFQARIFEKFTQADSSDQRKKGGTGLGLSIAKLIVEGHGGQLEFTSEEGVGTTFYINMKRPPADSDTKLNVAKGQADDPASEADSKDGKKVHDTV